MARHFLVKFLDKENNIISNTVSDKYFSFIDNEFQNIKSGLQKVIDCSPMLYILYTMGPSL